MLEAMTTPKQNRKIVQTAITIVAIIALIFLAKWYLSDRHGAEQQAGMQGGQQQAPSVVAVVAVKADLAIPREYVGRVESIQTVDVRPQVAGEIAQVHFKEGSAVKAGQLLFTLDSQQFQATVALRRADLAKAEANYDRAVKYYDRLKAADKRSVSASDLDIAQNDVLQNRASIEQARASLRLAQIDFGYTKITAPISGQIGKAAYTKGNYVTPAGGALASIVQIDPIRVAFSLPDKDYLDQFSAFKASGSSVYNASLRLADGSLYPFKGTRDFEDNAMDEKTGTIAVRIRFKNDRGVLVPGSMVRVEAKPAKDRVAIVVPQEAILADNQGDYVYSIDESNVVHQSRVALGAEIGSMREVTSGLGEGAKVVVRGLQNIRPEMTVNATMQQQGGVKTPAELAKEATDDLKPLSGDNAGSVANSSAEGKK